MIVYAMIVWGISSALPLLLLLRCLGGYHREIVVAASMSFFFTTCAALLGIFNEMDHQSLLQPYRLLTNAAYFLGLPMICLSLFSLCYPLSFSKGTWGRFALGCMVFFELARRFNLMHAYQSILLGCCLLITLFCVYRTKAALGFAICLLASSVCLLAAWAILATPVLILTFTPQSLSATYLFSINNFIWGGVLFWHLKDGCSKSSEAGKPKGL